jgi:hypothetical protein
MSNVENHVIPLGFRRYAVYRGVALASGLSRVIAENLAQRKISTGEAERMSQLEILERERGRLAARISEIDAKLAEVGAPHRPALRRTRHLKRASLKIELKAVAKEIAALKPAAPEPAARLTGSSDDLRADVAAVCRELDQAGVTPEKLDRLSSLLATARMCGRSGHSASALRVRITAMLDPMTPARKRGRFVDFSNWVTAAKQTAEA